MSYVFILYDIMLSKMHCSTYHHHRQIQQNSINARADQHHRTKVSRAANETIKIVSRIVEHMQIKEILPC